SRQSGVLPRSRVGLVWLVRRRKDSVRRFACEPIRQAVRMGPDREPHPPKADPMLESEDKLIEMMKAGDREALGQWLNMRRGPLLAFIERRLGAALRRKVDPDDLLQE